MLLEDTLIKEHQPPHNVRLKDDKSFLMVRLDHRERFPRLKLVRAHHPNEGKPGGRSRLFGPFASAVFFAGRAKGSSWIWVGTWERADLNWL